MPASSTAGAMKPTDGSAKALRDLRWGNISSRRAAGAVMALLAESGWTWVGVGEPGALSSLTHPGQGTGSRPCPGATPWSYCSAQ
ncbi:hypothetical protein GCM10027067_31510 [Pseudactinotalea suaedae]